MQAPDFTKPPKPIVRKFEKKNEPHYYHAYTAVANSNYELCMGCNLDEWTGEHICVNCGKYPMGYDCAKARC